MMKKNLFVLMLSAFVLTNAHPSYAVKPDGNEDSSSSSHSPKKKWVPQTPMRPKKLVEWEKKIEENPTKYGDYEIRGKILGRWE